MDRIIIRILVIALILSAALTSGALARTWHIEPGGSGDAPTIQAGVDSAAAGDTLLLACGTYNEYNIVMKSGLCIRGETGDPSCAVIDAQQMGRVFYCDGVDATACFEGMTIKNGRAPIRSDPFYTWAGGGMFCTNGSSPSISGVVFLSNRAGDASGLFCELGSSPVLTDVTFDSNTNFALGGGMVCCRRSYPTYSGVIFRENVAGEGGGLMYDFSEAQAGDATTITGVSFLENISAGIGGGLCLFGEGAPDVLVRVSGVSFIGNRSNGCGGGMACWDMPAVISACTFDSNTCDDRAGGIYSYFADGLLIESCTFYRNSSGEGSSMTLSYTDALVTNSIISYGIGGEPVRGRHTTLECCDVYGNAGGDYVGSIEGQNGVNGNFSACPSFCYADLGDFQLCDESPCLPGNHPEGYNCGLIGAWGEGCSCGPTASKPTTWGSIKAMYR